jgi:hypothetical protein
MFVEFENLRHHQHTNLPVNDNISIHIQDQMVNYKLLTVTYFNGSHFIQKSKLNNGDIITYDGMGTNQGRAQRELTNQFPSTFKDNNETWAAHVAWYQRTNILTNKNHVNDSSPSNTPHHAVPINVTDLTLDVNPNSYKHITTVNSSSISSNNHTSNNYNNIKNTNEHLELYITPAHNALTDLNSNSSSSNRKHSRCSSSYTSSINANECHVHSINTESHITPVHNSSKKKRSSSSSSSSSSSNTPNINANECYVNNINTEPNTNNCHIYPVLSPPQIVFVEDSEQQDSKRARKQDSTRLLPRKRTINEVVPQALTETTSRRPKGLCSPGTAEGPTGQG